MRLALLELVLKILHGKQVCGVQAVPLMQDYGIIINIFPSMRHLADMTVLLGVPIAKSRPQRCNEALRGRIKEHRDKVFFGISASYLGGAEWI
jgi:hypothetical protein